MNQQKAYLTDHNLSSKTLIEYMWIANLDFSCGRIFHIDEKRKLRVITLPDKCKLHFDLTREGEAISVALIFDGVHFELNRFDYSDLAEKSAKLSWNFKDMILGDLIQLISSHFDEIFDHEVEDFELTSRRRIASAAAI